MFVRLLAVLSLMTFTAFDVAIAQVSPPTIAARSWVLFDATKREEGMGPEAVHEAAERGLSELQGVLAAARLSQTWSAR